MAYGASHLQNQLYWQARQDIEKELLFRGGAYQQAIESYYNALPDKQLPSRLEDLIYDNRFLNPKRHIRALYPPLIADKWTIVYATNQKILGVYIDSEKIPLKKSGFNQRMSSFYKSRSYKDWKFVFINEI